MKIVVIGGTGLIGSKVVAKLTSLGHEVLAAAPNTGVNTLTGEGLDGALAGADIVIDLANSPTFDDAAIDFFTTAGNNLIAAEQKAGVKLHVALSVVGTERLVASGYFRGKLAQETLIKASPVPYTLVHATQFMEFLRAIGQAGADGDMIRLSHASIQPIAAEDVADAVVEAALSPAANATIEIAGPETYAINEIVARVLAYDKDPRAVVIDPDARYFGLRLEEKSLVAGPDARLGKTTFDWWIENVAPPTKK